MTRENLKNDTLLLVTAAIWGFAFVAQRVGMDHIGPFWYNGIRFAIGSLSLLPVIRLVKPPPVEPAAKKPGKGAVWAYGAAAGAMLFLGASLQQVGIVRTTAGNAGFITTFYVVLVPFLGIFLGRRTEGKDWVGAVLAIVGLYFLSITDRFTLASGDVLVFASAFFWAGHVLVIGAFSGKVDPVKLSAVQFATCSALSLAVGAIAEPISFRAAAAAAVPILYGGVMSVGVAYTLQVVAQRRAHPSHAAILLSLEGVFAALGGVLLLGETMTPRGLGGCALVLAGTLVSQGIVRFRKTPLMNA